MVNDNCWSDHFDQINSLLVKTRQYWQILPFEHLDTPWLSNPQLYNALSYLTSEDIVKLECSDKKLRQFLEPLISLQLDIIDDLPIKKLPIKDVPAHFKAGIKGRKWSQIASFEALLAQNSSPVIEWCAGKGHLGRLIGLNSGNEVTSLEWQSSLCQQGRALALKHSVNQSFIEADVFNIDASLLLQSSHHAVALHACGELHCALLKHAAKQRVSMLSFAPCCYHLISTTHYEPLSTLAKNSSLRLSRQDLSLSMQQTVIATKRERNHRVIEVSWRLGFDLLQRELRKEDCYLSLPSIKQSLLSGTFKDFCRWACHVKNLTFNECLSLDSFESRGYERQRLNLRIEVVTHAFRQLLERWLLLDRVLFLQENGYNVALFNFCESEITPRNAMVQATKKPT
jgi:hypothetical protein